jgi:Fe-Mn family superoxide dismutase
MPRSVSVSELRKRLEAPEAPIVLDVRRPQAFAESPDTIPGASRRLPEAVDAWADELPPNCEVVAYCVLGQQVSQGVVARLEQRGIKASFLEGGIEQWKADGGPLLEAAPAPAVESASASEPDDVSPGRRELG